MNKQEVRDKIDPIIDAIIPETFTSEYMATANRDEIRTEALGIIVSKWSGWDGFKIMRVAFEALEDANFHTEAAVLADMLEKAGA